MQLSCAAVVSILIMCVNLTMKGAAHLMKRTAAHT